MPTACNVAPAPAGPRRVLAAATLIDSLGDGLFLAGSALFFTRGLGLAVATVGVGLSIAGVIGLVLGAELGRLADRYGARTVFVTLMSVQALAVAGYVGVRGLAGLVTTATVAALARQGAQAARGAMVGQLAGAGAAGLRARLHVVMNVGIALGAALAGGAIARDTHGAYLALMLTDAATFVLAAGIALALPGRAPAAQGGGPRRRQALTDRRFLALTGLSAVVSLQFVLTGYLLPLWVVGHTAAPRWLSSPLLLINTVVVVVLQVPCSNRFTGLSGAAAAYRLAGVALAGACLLFAAAAVPGRWGATVMLVAAICAASVAEVLSLAGAFGVSFGLAPAHAVGEYQGVWNLGFGTAMALGPALLTFTVLDTGGAGWVGLALAVALAGVAVRRLTLSAPLPAGPLVAGAAVRG